MSELQWAVVRIAPHLEAVIAFSTLLWHPWAGDVLLSRRLAMLYTALVTLSVREALHYARHLGTSQYDVALDDSKMKVHKLVKRAEDRAWAAIESCFAPPGGSEGGGEASNPLESGEGAEHTTADSDDGQV